MSDMNNDEIYERGYELGFDDGYNKAILDLQSKCKKHIEDMMKNICKELANEEITNVHG